MAESILNGKRLLAVDDEPDVLESLEELVLADAPGCRIDKAGRYEDAVALLERNAYDLVVLDIMGVRGFDLLETAVRRGFKVAMLTTSLKPMRRASKVVGADNTDALTMPRSNAANASRTPPR